MTDNSDSEEYIERLVKHAGPRPDVPADVRKRMEMTFRSQLDRQRRQRRFMGAIAATVAAVSLVLIGSLLWPGESPQRASALADRVQGRVEWTLGDETRPLLAGKQLRVGEVLRAGDGRARIAAGNAGLRLDRNTSVRVTGRTDFRLLDGSVYVDARGGESGINIETPHGVVRHTGTQYLVSVDEQDTLIAVREGSITVTNGDRIVTGNAANGEGEMIRFIDDEVTRSTITGREERWHWVNEISPRFDTRDRSVHEFLIWLARETGRELDYADEKTEQLAREKKIRGAVDTTVADDALREVLSITRFEVRQPIDGVLHVRRS